MPEQKRILFLYTELAGYFLACVDELVRQSGAQVYIVRWPLNNEAPFQFSFSQGVILYDRQRLDDEALLKLVSKIDPHLIYCSGWIDKGYVNVCRQWKNRVPVVAGIDTQWNGSLRQRINALMSPYTVRRNFTHLWVAGEPQRKYAQKLGFGPGNILTGVYAADVPFFEKYYHGFRPAKVEVFPKRFVFVGRYLPFKGIYDLWEAFIQTFDHATHDWELWCLGTGDDWEKRVKHARIRHLGFVQPGKMEQIIAQTGVFVLPSHFEPWAVAVHEFAAAGFPLVCSNRVGASTAFLHEGHNGFVFKAGDVAGLRDALLGCIRADAGTLLQMGDRSHELALKISPQTWSQGLLRLLSNR